MILQSINYLSDSRDQPGKSHKRLQISSELIQECQNCVAEWRWVCIIICHTKNVGTSGKNALCTHSFISLHLLDSQK